MTQNDPIKQPIRIPGSMAVQAGASVVFLEIIFFLVIGILNNLPEAVIAVESDPYMYNDTRVNLTLSLVKDFSVPTLAFTTIGFLTLLLMLFAEDMNMNMNRKIKVRKAVGVCWVISSVMNAVALIMWAILWRFSDYDFQSTSASVISIYFLIPLVAMLYMTLFALSIAMALDCYKSGYSAHSYSKVTSVEMATFKQEPPPPPPQTIAPPKSDQQTLIAFQKADSEGDADAAHAVTNGGDLRAASVA